jgi:hypothetical protein
MCHSTVACVCIITFSYIVSDFRKSNIFWVQFDTFHSIFTFYFYFFLFLFLLLLLLFIILFILFLLLLLLLLFIILFILFLFFIFCRYFYFTFQFCSNFAVCTIPPVFMLISH